MQIVANHMNLLLRSNPYKNNVVRICFLFRLVFACFEFYLDLSLFSLCIVFLIAYVRYCLSMLDFPECEACFYESFEFFDRQKGKLHFVHTLLYLVFTMH